MKTELTARNDLFIAQSGVLNVAKINKISKMQAHQIRSFHKGPIQI